MVGVVDRKILDAVVFRWASGPYRDQFLIRGSYLTGIWVGPNLRPCEDLDFLARFPATSNPKSAFQKATDAMTQSLAIDTGDGLVVEMEQLTYTPIFEETNFPGVRITVGAGFPPLLSPLQIDIAFNDPLPLEVSTISVLRDENRFDFPAAQPELAYAWKLHGLVEKEGLGWRPKDLADLWLIQNHVSLKRPMLAKAIRVAFESRDGPFWRLDRLINKQMGSSTGSQRRWRKFVTSHPEGGYPSTLADVVEAVSDFVRELVLELRTDDPQSPLCELCQSEFQKLVDREKSFRAYQWNPQASESFGTVFHCERANKETLPNPLHAATGTEYRERSIRKECRGITFAHSGEVLARPYAQFERMTELSSSEFGTATILEKLDGSLVFPTATEHAWVWRTRRGLSEIATSVSEFVRHSESDYRGLVDHLTQSGRTPLFEWCSRSRPIVLDHPKDRLVLTGIRDNQSGRLASYDELTQLADRWRIELVSRIRVEICLDDWKSEVQNWVNREGCVVRLTDGRQFKIKSDQYRWLHQAIEGPGKDRARWHLIASGFSETLTNCCERREIDMGNYTSQFQLAIEGFCQPLIETAYRFLPATQANRKRLASELRPMPNLHSRLIFAIYDGHDPSKLMQRIIVERCQSEQAFQRLARTMDGPIRGDG